MPATVLWFTSNRFARKSNYPRGEHAEEPRIKKHWDLRKISTRYKSKPFRNLLFLVFISYSLFRRRLIIIVICLAKRLRISKSVRFLDNKRNDFNAFTNFAIAKCIINLLNEDVNRRLSMAKYSVLLSPEWMIKVYWFFGHRLWYWLNYELMWWMVWLIIILINILSTCNSYQIDILLVYRIGIFKTYC